MFPILWENEYIDFCDGQIVVCNIKTGSRTIWVPGTNDGVRHQKIRSPYYHGQMQAEIPTAA